MANIRTIKYPIDSAAHMISQLDSLRHVKAGLMDYQFSAIEALRKQSVLAENMLATSNLYSAIQDQQSAFQRLQEINISSAVEYHLNAFKNISTSLNMLQATQYATFEKIKEQSLLSSSLKAFDSLKSVIDVNQFLTVDKIQSLFESSVFNQQYIDSLKAISGDIAYAKIFLRDEIDINPDGTLTIGEDVVSTIELDESIKDFFAYLRDTDLIDESFEYLKKLKKPIRAVIFWILDKLIVAFIIGVAVNIYTPAVQEYFNQFTFNSRRELIQQIKKLPPDINLTALSDYRVVTTDHLRLRKHPNMSSSIIYELSRGKLVKVLKKQKDWTFIEVDSCNSEEVLSGWVFTRYIAKLKR